MWSQESPQATGNLAAAAEFVTPAAAGVAPAHVAGNPQSRSQNRSGGAGKDRRDREGQDERDYSKALTNLR